jgi:hypothetical protein
MGTLTKERLIQNRGVNLGFFIMRPKGVVRLSPNTGEKCQVFAKDGVKRVWNGVQWLPYDAYESNPRVEAAIEACEAFNGKIL